MENESGQGSNAKKNVITGLLWKFLENFGKQGINFILQIILARILLPEDYGIIGITTVFILISNVFIQTGFSSALIQNKDVNDTDYSTVFYINLVISAFIYIILFFLTPIIASFYSEPTLTLVLRIQAINLFFGAINSVQYAVISRKLEFKKSFISSIFSIIIQGFVGIIMAYQGYGVWALVISQLAYSIVITIIMWFIVDFKPKLLFSFIRLKKLFSYSSKILFVTLLNTLFQNLHTLVIGRFFSKTTLGYYSRGQSIPYFLMNNTDGAMASVMFPAFSHCQNDKKRLKEILRRSIKTSFFVISPMLIGLFIVAKPLIVVLLTPKWIASVPILQLSCVICLSWPFSANTHAINAIGRSDVTLVISIIIKTLTVLFLFVSIRWGLYAILVAEIVTSYIAVIILLITSKKLLNYHILEQTRDVLPSIVLSLLMGIIIYFVKYLQLSVLFTLILQVLLGAIFYVLLAWLLKFECLNYLITTFIEILDRKKSK